MTGGGLAGGGSVVVPSSSSSAHVTSSTTHPTQPANPTSIHSHTDGNSVMMSEGKKPKMGKKKHQSVPSSSSNKELPSWIFDIDEYDDEDESSPTINSQKTLFEELEIDPTHIYK